MRSRRRHVPVTTIVLLTVGAVVLALVSFELVPNPDVGGGARLVVFLLLVPPALGLAGAVTASRDRRLGDQGRVLWSVASGLGGFLQVFFAFVLVTLIAGP